MKVEKLIDLYKTSIYQGSIRKDILDEALLISESIFYINRIAKCFNRLGIAARYEQDYIQSISYHKRALDYFEKSTDTLSKIKCLNSIGVSYRKLNLESEAYNNYLQALRLSEAINNSKSIAIALSGIGNIYWIPKSTIRHYLPLKGPWKSKRKITTLRGKHMHMPI